MRGEGVGSDSQDSGVSSSGEVKEGESLGPSSRWKVALRPPQGSGQKIESPERTGLPGQKGN